jgi:hypothetical protein
MLIVDAEEIDAHRAPPMVDADRFQAFGGGKLNLVQSGRFEYDPRPIENLRGSEGLENYAASGPFPNHALARQAILR